MAKTRVFAAILAENLHLKALLRRYGHFKEYAAPALQPQAAGGLTVGHMEIIY
jgi:hypothetical protein